MMEHNTPGTAETVVVVVPFISGEAQSEFLEGELVFEPLGPLRGLDEPRGAIRHGDLDLRPRAARAGPLLAQRRR